MYIIFYFLDTGADVVHHPPVVRPLDYLHSYLLLQNRLMDVDETW